MIEIQKDKLPSSRSFFLYNQYDQTYHEKKHVYGVHSAGRISPLLIYMFLNTFRCKKCSTFGLFSYI